jgi:hypothetical protein
VSKIKIENQLRNSFSNIILGGYRISGTHLDEVKEKIYIER